MMVPPVEVVERLTAEAITRANRRICATLVGPLSEEQRVKLDGWLELKPGARVTPLPRKSCLRTRLQPLSESAGENWCARIMAWTAATTSSALCVN